MGGASYSMGPRPLLTLALHITLPIYFISSRLFILLYVICVMVNKAVNKKKKNESQKNTYLTFMNTLGTTT